jgi:4-amino-4-deoxy-L-arabinose transferase-like glycosyltransferase
LQELFSGEWIIFFSYMSQIQVADALIEQIRKPDDIQMRRKWAITTAIAVLVCVFAWLGFGIPRGTLTHTDELLTAERSREMLLTGPWVVHYNFQRSFEKPPLQFWLTTLTLSQLHNRTLAVRFWPLLYGCLTMVALGWLVFLVQPNRPWLVPLSLAVLASSPLFSPEASRGFLDIGLTFFTVSAILFAQLARDRPAWWLGVAAACWLGSLQKFPMPFLVWVLIILVRLTSRVERPKLRSGWLVASMLLAFATMAIWPLIQITKYGMSPARVFHEEVVVWTGSANLGARPYFAVLYGLSTIGSACGLLSLLAAFLVLFSKKERSSESVREISIVSLAVIGLTIVSNFRGVRYIVPIIPCLCFLLALVFYRFLERRPIVRLWTAVVLIAVLSEGFVQSAITIERRRKDAAEEKQIAEKLGELQQAGMKSVLVKAEMPGKDLLWDSFYLFHGNLRFPVQARTVEQIRRNPPKPPLVGVCVARDFPAIREVYPRVQVELSRAQFTCWRVSGQ